MCLDTCSWSAKGLSPKSCVSWLQASGANSQAHPSDYDPTNTTLFIGGLSSSVTEEDLRVLFGRYGDTVYTKIPPGKGCGFVQFVQRPAAEAAMGQMQVRCSPRQPWPPLHKVKRTVEHLFLQPASKCWSYSHNGAGMRVSVVGSLYTHASVMVH